MSSQSKKNKKKAAFNFNEDIQQQTISRPKGHSKKGRVFDFNQIENDHLQQQTASKLENDTKQSLRFNALAQTSMQSIYLPLDSNIKGSPNAVKLPQIDRETSSPSQPVDTAEDIGYAQQLLVGLFEGRFSEELIQLIQQNIQLGKDKQTHHRALVFLSFYNFVEGLVHIDHVENGKSGYQMSVATQQSFIHQSPIERLKQWLSNMLCSRFVPHHKLNLQKLPPKLIHFARNRLHRLAQQYQRDKKWTQTFLLANMPDEIAFEYLNVISEDNQLRKELNVMALQDVNLMQKSCWLVQLGIVINFYYDEYQDNQEQLIEHLKKIYRRYFVADVSFLRCQLLAVVLFFEGDRQIVEETHLRKVIKAQGKFKELNLVFLLFVLKPKINRFKTAVHEIVQILVKNIENPRAFIEIIEFAQLNVQKLPKLLKLLINQNSNFSKNHSENMVKLQHSIEQKIGKSGQDYSQYCRIMHNWGICKQLLELHQKQQHFAFLEYYIQHYRQLQQNVIPQQQIIQALKLTLTNYQLACSYKKQTIAAFYSILQRLQNIVTDDLRAIVKGSLAFIQFKRGAFHLRTSLQCLYQLVEQIELIASDVGSSTLSNSHYDNKQLIFSRYIAKSIIKQLKRPDGRIFVQQVCKKVPSDHRNTLIEQLQKGKQNSSRRRQFAQSKIYKLLTITRWDSLLLNQIIIKLVVQW